MTTEQLPRLVLTAGEPAGIGPELCLTMANMDWPAEIVVCASRDLLLKYDLQLNTSVEIVDWQPGQAPSTHVKGKLACYNVPMPASHIPGKLEVRNGGYVLETLQLAAELVLQGRCDAIITAPVHKGIINDAGVDFSGHTEFFANLANSHSVMMLACPDFRVALVTTHLPLVDVSAAITEEALVRVITILHHDLQSKYGIESPCIHVCGLNPHAGEGGYLGMEEINVITPCLEKLRNKGINLIGPLPADTALTPSGMRGADVTLAMYHDQGLSVLKYAGFGSAVNITLGLPFIRVSVDHGTALDLAGRGEADIGSMVAAMNEALTMLNAR
ncbi:MAG: 4-hydroxythreonine-4-phosphate dehydrogenase PdxA [Enterobacterales bacterium]|nr:4-hydroxythreonine-4-phosphate dehydrogenase PdxA [Enterobacterales bacterium]